MRSNQQLDQLVDRCEQLVSGVAPQSLRDNDSLRSGLCGRLAGLQSSLDQLMVGQWMADLSPVGGPQLGSFVRRADTIAAEVNWLRENWLLKSV